jgi:HD superfamily phosphohydrolase
MTSQSAFCLNPLHKRIGDTIHGFINISNISQRIIDSPRFQRLHNLKQLGTCYKVYPAAKHSRFEHSIGTYHLAGRLLKAIVLGTPPDKIHKDLANIKELESYYKKTYNGVFCVLDDYVCELVKIAGLCHDLGHGPFSHVFDDVFLPQTKFKDSPNAKHEVRSCLLLRKIIKEDNLLSQLITDDEIQFMFNLINPQKEHSGFIYQIISNNLNGLDVDKYDYLPRDTYMTGVSESFDCDRLVDEVKVKQNKICYPKQAGYVIKKMSDTRYNLHTQVYNHKITIAAQGRIIDYFNKIDKLIGLAESIEDLDKFCEMTDDYVLTCTTSLLGPRMNLSDEEKKLAIEAHEIINKYNAHNFYAFVDHEISQNDLKITKSDFAKFGFDESDDNLIIHVVKIGYVSGNKPHPLDNIYVYDTKDKESDECFKLDKKKISLLIPENYQEYVTYIYYRNKENEKVEQLRTIFKKILESRVDD